MVPACVGKAIMTQATRNDAFVVHHQTYTREQGWLDAQESVRAVGHSQEASIPVPGDRELPAIHAPAPPL